jgi:hypothetical protein
MVYRGPFRYGGVKIEREGEGLKMSGKRTQTMRVEWHNCRTAH